MSIIKIFILKILYKIYKLFLKIFKNEKIINLNKIFFF